MEADAKYIFSRQLATIKTLLFIACELVSGQFIPINPLSLSRVWTRTHPTSVTTLNTQTQQEIISEQNPIK